VVAGLSGLISILGIIVMDEFLDMVQLLMEILKFLPISLDLIIIGRLVLLNDHLFQPLKLNQKQRTISF
jgi:hypothetical protein